MICDFRGFEKPEMVKRRPVIVVAANQRNYRLVTIVPLSTTIPRRPLPWHYPLADPIPSLAGGRVVWAKCDLLYTVSTARLEKVRVGPNRLATLQIDERDYLGICAAVLAGLRLAPNP